MMEEEIARPPANRHVLGMDLATLSVTELRERIEALRDEVARLEAELQRKGASLAAAENLFSRG